MISKTGWLCWQVWIPDLKEFDMRSRERKKERMDLILRVIFIGMVTLNWLIHNQHELDWNLFDFFFCIFVHFPSFFVNKQQIAEFLVNQSNILKIKKNSESKYRLSILWLFIFRSEHCIRNQSLWHKKSNPLFMCVHSSFSFQVRLECFRSLQYSR